MEERAWIMKIASLKFSEEEKPSFYDVKVDDNRDVRYYNEEGRLHRLDGPAIEYASGTKAWYVNGKRHRLDGPAVVWGNNKVWYVNGKQHRLDGPAVEFSDGGKVWYVHGKRHRLDGPAIEYANGDKEWWVNGKRIGKSTRGFTDKKFEQWKKKHGYESRFKV